MSARRRAPDMLRVWVGLAALSLALSAPNALVLCESDDGHVAVERTHVGGVCFAEAVRHAEPQTVSAEAQPVGCADTVVDVRLLRSTDGHEALTPLATASLELPAAAIQILPARVERATRAASTELLRTIVLRL